MPESAPRSFQEIILRLQTYWAGKGCAILQPYDMEVGAGTFHPHAIKQDIHPFLTLSANHRVQTSSTETGKRYSGIRLQPGDGLRCQCRFRQPGRLGGLAFGDTDQ